MVTRSPVPVVIDHANGEAEPVNVDVVYVFERVGLLAVHEDWLPVHTYTVMVPLFSFVVPLNFS